MTSLVEELQHDALNSAVEVTDLLRKAFVVATKLKLEKFKEWCQAELDGYKGKGVPDYRKLRGELKAWNPYNGWIPVIFNDNDFRRDLSTCPERSPIASIQDLLRSNGKESSTSFVVKLSPEIQKALMTRSNPFECSIHLSRGQVIGIVNAVRNTILEWSLKLEADGILGSGMSFSPTEKTLAVEHAVELQSIVNNITIESMNNSTIQQASPRARQRR